MPRAGFKFVLVVGNRVLTPIAERTRRDSFRTTERQRSSWTAEYAGPRKTVDMRESYGTSMWLTTFLTPVTLAASS